MTLPNRTYGVEIELKSLSPEQAANILREGGVNVQHTSYTHERTDYWKVLTDGSLHGTSCEVVSPVLTGEEGIEELRKVCRLLSRGGGRVDRQCGLHVHVGTDDLTGNDVAMVISRYAQFESEIDQWMPASRRANENTYCRSITSLADRLRGNAFTTIRQVCDSYSSDRYFKINLDSYRRHRTVEFRQHSGTINGTKVESWVRFLLHFVEASRGQGVQIAERLAIRAPSRPARGLIRPPQRLRANSIEAKLDRVINAFRAEPTSLLTDAQIAEVAGWSVASVAPYVTRLRQERGCDLRKVRGSNRYYLVPGTGRLSNEDAPEGAEVVETQQAARTVLGVGRLENDTVFRGIPEEVASFFAERAAEFTTM